MPTVTTTSGKRFNLQEGESILEAALKDGVQLAYSCRTGRCHSCKCKVLEGQSVPLHQEFGLPEPDKALGWVLACVRTAGTDLHIEAEDLGDIAIAPPRTAACRIDALTRLAPDVVGVTLRLPPNAAFPFRAGQYIDLIGPGGVRRSYSLANAPGTAKTLELHVRMVPDGVMSSHLFGQAKVNDLLRLHGPLGTFFLRDIAALDLVFLATGTGIAPVKAMLEDLASWPEQDRPRSVTVYWGGRTEADLYWPATQGCAPHHLVKVLSRADENWTGPRGHVQDVLLKQGFDAANTAVYACGSDAMIQDAQRALSDAGLPARRFHSDAFVSSGDVK